MTQHCTKWMGERFPGCNQMRQQGTWERCLDHGERWLSRKMFGPWGEMTVPKDVWTMGRDDCQERCSDHGERWLSRTSKDKSMNGHAASPLPNWSHFRLWRYGETQSCHEWKPGYSCRPSLSMLKGSDTQIRGHVKSLLHLPVQTTNATLYARTRKDGLEDERPAQTLPEEQKRDNKKADTRTRRKRHARGPVRTVSTLPTGPAGPEETKRWKHRRGGEQLSTEGEVVRIPG